MIRILGCVIIGLLVLSCVNNSVWNQVQTIPNQQWNVKTKFPFQYESEDTSSAFKLYVDIRHSTQYKYSNLYLFVTTKAPNGQSIKDTLEVLVANGKGQWFGKGLSDIKQLRLLYKPHVMFAQKGSYTFEIEQAMRDEVLKHITDIGIRIEKE